MEDDSGIGKVLVNNTEATVDKSGNFSTDVFLVKGIGREDSYYTYKRNNIE